MIYRFYPWVGVPISLAVLAAAYVVAPAGKLSASFALAGSILAVLGVITLARPILRMGGYRRWYAATKIVDYGHIEPTPEEIAEEEQASKDAAAVQCWGPALIAVGTLLNGASGFF